MSSKLVFRFMIFLFIILTFSALLVRVTAESRPMF